MIWIHVTKTAFICTITGDDPASSLGIDHTKLTYRFQGRDYRLTGFAGEVVKPLLA